MLNIRINFTVNLRKVAAGVAAGTIFLSHLFAPAYAITAKPAVSNEKAVTVNLTYLKVTTTRTEALEAVNSPQAKYFDAEALAFLTTYTQGWTMAEWSCLRYVWQKESHFNPKALNMHSGAYGIAQFLPSTWGNYKVVKTPEAKLQIKYGLRYIEKRYGSACEAKAFWVKHGWY